MSTTGKPQVAVHGGQLRIEQGNDRLIVSEESGPGLFFDKILIGRDELGQVVIKVARQDVDVKTATPEELILSSEYNMFKIVSKSTATLTSPNLIGSSSFINQSFSLGTKPVIFAFAALGSSGGTRYPLPLVQPQLSADPNPGLVAYQLGYEVVVDQLTFFWRDITKAHNITAYITYYICLETAN